MQMAEQMSTVIRAAADDAKRYWLEEGRKGPGFIREVDFAHETRGLDPLFAGIKIVDCDTHFTEPADLWTANAPAGMKDKMPHVRRVDDSDSWFVGDKYFGSLGGNVIAKDRNKLLGKLAYKRYEQIDPGSYDVSSRLEAMDAMGVWAQICFQNGGVTQAGSVKWVSQSTILIPANIGSSPRVSRSKSISRMNPPSSPRPSSSQYRLASSARAFTTVPLLSAIGSPLCGRRCDLFAELLGGTRPTENAVTHNNPYRKNRWLIALAVRCARAGTGRTRR
jgi:hypothetical protein